MAVYQIGLAVETDIARPVGVVFAQTITIGQPVETDTAGGIPFLRRPVPATRIPTRSLRSVFESILADYAEAAEIEKDRCPIDGAPLIDHPDGFRYCPNLVFHFPDG